MNPEIVRKVEAYFSDVAIYKDSAKKQRYSVQNLISDLYFALPHCNFHSPVAKSTARTERSERTMKKRQDK